MTITEITAKDILKKGKLLNHPDVESSLDNAETDGRSEEFDIEVNYLLNGITYTFVIGWEFKTTGRRFDDPSKDTIDFHLTDFYIDELYSVNEENNEVINHDFTVVDEDNLKSLLMPTLTI